MSIFLFPTYHQLLAQPTEMHLCRYHSTLQPVPFEKHKSFGRETDYHLTEGVPKYEEVIFVHIPKTAGWQGSLDF